MNRRGTSNVVYLVLIVAISGMVFLYAAMLSEFVSLSMAHNAFETRTDTHTKTIGAVVDDYLVDVVEWSVYQTTYEEGKTGGGTGAWSEGSIPERSAIKQHWEEEAVADMKQYYFRSSFRNSICRSDGGAFTATAAPDSSRGGITVLFDTEEPPNITCTAVKGASSHFFSLPDQHFSADNRYFTLAQTAIDLANDAAFQSAFQQTVDEEPDTVTVDACREGGTCDFNPPDPSFHDDHPVESKYEEHAWDRVRQRLRTVKEGYEGDGITISYRVQELEYRIDSWQQTATGWTRTGCAVSDTDTVTEYGPDPSQCAPDEEPVCHEEDSCAFAGQDPRYCTECSNRDDGPGLPGSTGQHWQLSCGEDPADPYQYSGRIPWTADDVAFEEGVLAPLDVSWRGADIQGGDGSTDAGTCEACQVTGSSTCEERLYPELQARTVWSFAFTGYLRVVVTVKDTEHMIPTADGEKHPVFRFVYQDVAR